MGHMKWMCARSDQWAFVDTRDTSSYSADPTLNPFNQIRQSSTYDLLANSSIVPPNRLKLSHSSRIKM